jgi:hypothetical protein
VFGFGRRQAPSSPELGALGTHAFVVTDWMFGPTTPPRLVNMGDTANEPLRRTRATKGPLALHADQTLPVFQGEKAPSPASAADVQSASDYIEAYTASVMQTGYPS